MTRSCPRQTAGSHHTGMPLRSARCLPSKSKTSNPPLSLSSSTVLQDTTEAWGRAGDQRSFPGCVPWLRAGEGPGTFWLSERPWLGEGSMGRRGRWPESWTDHWKQGVPGGRCEEAHQGPVSRVPTAPLAGSHSLPSQHGALSTHSSSGHRVGWAYMAEGALYTRQDACFAF